MRSALLAVLLLAPSAAHAANDCKFYNQDGQSIVWAGDSVIVDPLYSDKFVCPLEPIPNSDAFTAKCGTWSTTVVIGYAKNEVGAEAIVWDNVFFWLKCVKDRA